jgi:hypothetical protein
MKATKRSRIHLFWVPLTTFLLFFSFASGQVLAQEKMVPRGGTLKVLYMEPTHLNPAIVVSFRQACVAENNFRGGAGAYFSSRPSGCVAIGNL